MMFDPFDHIEEYLSGTLSESQSRQFEELLKSNSELQKAVENFPIAKKLAQGLIELETRKQLSKLKQNSSAPYWNWILAASIIVLLLIAYFINRRTEETPVYKSPEQIFALLYEAPASSGFRNEVELLNKLDSGVYFFDLKQLNQSLILFQEVLDSDSSQLLAKVYVSHILLETGDFEKATIWLEDLSNTASEPYNIKAQYHLCMVYLIQGKKAEAQKLFEELEHNKSIPEEKVKIISGLLK